MVLGNMKLSGIILEASTVKEFDKRLVILTKERGRITVFAHGAKRPKSPFLACTRPFTYAVFEVFASRDSYRLENVEGVKLFEGIAEELEKVYYGSYFCETAGFFSRENNDDSQLFKLLYVSLLALSGNKIEPQLIKTVFEWRSFYANGIGADIFSCSACRTKENLVGFDIMRKKAYCPACLERAMELGTCSGELTVKLSPAAFFALSYIATADIKKVFDFNVSQSVLEELSSLCERYMETVVDRPLKSLAALKEIISLSKMTKK